MFDVNSPKYSKKKGDISTHAIILATLKKGYVVSVPIGDCDRYDLLLDDGQSLKRMQCKTANLYKDGNSFCFPTYSRNLLGTKYYTAKEIDCFGIYLAERDKVYVVPIEAVLGCGMPRLRLNETRNGQLHRIRLARDFEF